MTELKEGVQILKEGGVGIFPTDTAFGIGCRMDNEKAIERLFTLRRRPPTQATPVLISSLDMATIYFSSPLPNNVRQLCRMYWPGALTVIYNCQIEKVPSLVRGGGITLGMRIPDHDIPLTLIQKVGVPLLAPSANFHTQNTPYKYEDLDINLLRLVDFVIPGTGKHSFVSTVIDCTKTPFQIVRQGVVRVTI